MTIGRENDSGIDRNSLDSAWGTNDQALDG